MANLAPYTPQGWDAPLVVSGSVDDHDGPGLRAGEEVYVSWAVANTPGTRVDGRFFIDLLFDGVTVWRWTNDLLPAQGYVDISGWPDLHRLTPIEPGPHTVTLVIDPTNLIAESDETDNRLDAEVFWLPPEAAIPLPPARERLPDLAPHTPTGWTDPLAASSSEDGVDGPLSVDAPARVLAAFTNSGAASTGLNIWAHLYLDDVLVDVSVSPGLLMGDSTRRLRVEDLRERIAISPGEHTLRLVIDPTGLVEESDESNNVYEERLEWVAGSLPSKRAATTDTAPAHPEPPSLPNLVPAWKFGWDGPIVVSRERGTSLDSAPVLGRAAYVDLAVANLSTVRPPRPFSVDLYFDDLKVSSFRFSTDSPASAETLLDWEGADRRGEADRRPSPAAAGHRPRECRGRVQRGRQHL